MKDNAYELMIEKLREAHDKWVSQNWKLRGLEMAIFQIHDEGDTAVEYAKEVLKNEHDSLSEINKKTWIELDCRRNFIREYEDIQDIESNSIREIFGY